MKKVSINPAGFDWGNLGWVPRSFSVEASSAGKQKTAEGNKGSIYSGSKREHPHTENVEFKKNTSRENLNLKIFVEFNSI